MPRKPTCFDPVLEYRDSPFTDKIARVCRRQIEPRVLYGDSSRGGEPGAAWSAGQC